MKSLAEALGGRLNGRWINIAGPGHSSSDRSLGFCFDPSQADGIRMHSFAGDDLTVCRKHLIKRLTALGIALGGVAESPDVVTVPLDEPHPNTAKAQMLWQQTIDPAGTLVQKYLESRRCHPACSNSLGNVIRFHPACVMGTTSVPAMIAAIRDITTGQLVGVHRTALADDGVSKRATADGSSAKMMLGRAKHAVVMVASAAPLMGIAEGIETALSAQKIFKIPVWACLSAKGVAKFPAIAGLKSLTVFADHDDVGIAAAEECVTRLLRRGVNGRIAYPSMQGDDWNCYLRKGRLNVI